MYFNTAHTLHWNPGSLRITNYVKVKYFFLFQDLNCYVTYKWPYWAVCCNREEIQIGRSCGLLSTLAAHLPCAISKFWWFPILWVLFSQLNPKSLFPDVLFSWGIDMWCRFVTQMHKKLRLGHRSEQPEVVSWRGDSLPSTRVKALVL